MSRPLLIGVDGGGTSTTVWLADAHGTVLGRGLAGPSNIKAVGADTTRANLDESVRLAFADSGLELAPVEVSCLGLAGFDRAEDKQWLRDWGSGTVWARRLVLVNDGDLVVAAGTPEGWGVGVIAGTGSIAVGRARDGRSARSGGWGYLLGDEGSAYAVALAGLRLVAQRADGRARPDLGRPGSLTLGICEALGIASTWELVATIYREGFDRTRIASLAPAVVKAAQMDESISDTILEPAGWALADMVAAVARQLHIESGVLPLAMAGSFLLNCSIVSAAMIGRLTELEYEINSASVLEPVTGALVLARRAFTP
jgi:N-acetylglucosamine kinase-like BadF-type ATPase